jgi:hypothetical protein
MSPSQIREIRTSKDAENVSQTRSEADLVGGSVLAGKDISPKLEKIITKAAPFRGQYDKLPNFTDEEWELVGRQIRFLSRMRGNIGGMVDDDGENTPKKISMMIWGRDESRKSPFPKKDEVKREVQEFVKSEKEAQKKAEEKSKKKMNEDFFRKFLED